MKKLILVALALFIASCGTPEVEDYAKAYNNRGLSHARRGQYDMAIAEWTNAIRLDPTYAEAYYNRGIAYGRKNQHDRAISDYTKAIESNPRYADAYYNRGLTYQNKDQFDKAISDYTKAVEVNPRYAKAYNNRGNAYKSTGQYDRAISDYTKSIELNPRYARVYNNRGHAYGLKGQYDQAISDYTKAIELEPRYGEAYNNLAWLLATCPDSRYRNGTKAIDMAETAIELGKSFGKMDTLAAAYAENGNFEEAIKTQEAAIAMFKNNADTRILAIAREHLESYKSNRPWRDSIASKANP